MKHYFWQTSKGQILKYRMRRKQEKDFVIFCEPKSKKAITNEEKRHFRVNLKSQLKHQHKKKYNEPLILKIIFFTTDKNPSHVTTLVKCYLDLMHKSEKIDNFSKILFNDDKDIKLLIARTIKVEKDPHIKIKTNTYHNFLEDIVLIEKIMFNDFYDEDDINKIDLEEEYSSLDDIVESINEIKHDRDYNLSLSGESFHNNLLHSYLISYQQQRLLTAKFKPTELIYLLNNKMSKYLPINGKIESSLKSIKLNSSNLIFLNINFFEVQMFPQKEGDSARIKIKLAEKIQKFKDKNSLLFPLRTPIKLTILFSNPSGLKNEIDPDNLVRTYIFPQVIDILEPPTKVLFGEDSTKNNQIFEYEVIQIPRNELTPQEGRISIFFSCFDHSDIYSEIEEIVEQWIEQL